MTPGSVSCFLPCRTGSQRIPCKNIKPFAHAQHGLIEIKLHQLLGVALIDKIVLSTNDPQIIELGERLNSSRLVIHKRREELSSCTTSTDELVAHARELITAGHILWTHVTSPFVTSAVYKHIIEKYFESLAQGYDSLMTTTPIHGFLWDAHHPLNYDRSKEKWPRTQTLPVVHEVNSAAFIASCSVYDDRNDRIGQKPFLLTLDKITGMDIDWPVDFQVAEQIALSGIATV